MKVSVILNNYNYASYIGEAVMSVLNQTYKNFELIIVDDGSTDNSRDIIDGFANQHPNLITKVYKSNGGQGSAFNAGYNVSKGEIIAFLDSDDYWFEDKLERIVREHENSDIVEHSLVINNKYCRYLENKENAQFKMKEYNIYSRFGETSSLSFTRLLLEKVFPIPEESLRICTETYVVYLGLYYSNKITTIKDALGFYRVHGKNNWYNNPNIDPKHFVKFIYLMNDNLLSRGLKPYPLGQYEIFKNIEMLNIDKTRNYILYGTGNASFLLTKYLNALGISIKFYIDSNISKRSEEKKIFHYKELPTILTKNDYIIIASEYKEEIKKNINEVITTNNIIELI